MNASNFKIELIKIFAESVNAVDAARLIAENVRKKGKTLFVCDKAYDISCGNVYLIGFGKAVLGMASECEKILGESLKYGIISVPEGARAAFKNNVKYLLKSDTSIRVFEGAKNNLPDENAEKGADAILNLVSSLKGKHDSLIALISGGGSALFPKPISGISLKEKLDTIAALTSSGANINELNTVRKKLSKVKGGGLAYLTYPCNTIALILSDVLNDPLDIIASGPTVLNTHETHEALDIIKKYNLINDIPKNVLNAILQPRYNMEKIIHNNGFLHVDNYLIGNNKKALKAARQFALASGYKAFTLTSEMKGLVEEVAEFYNNLITTIINCFYTSDTKTFELELKVLLKNTSFHCDDEFLKNMLNFMTSGKNDANKICIIGGGETTVRLKGNGKGGRNQELALIMLAKIAELKNNYHKFFDEYDVLFLSAGTDGIDGPTDVAGAIVEYEIFKESLQRNVSIEKHLKNNDSYNFFLNINNGSSFIKTGHTGTNVADVHLISFCKK